MLESSKVMQKKVRPKQPASFECNVLNCLIHEAEARKAPLADKASTTTQLSISEYLGDLRFLCLGENLARQRHAETFLGPEYREESLGSPL